MELLGTLHGFLWGPWMLALFLGTGVWLTIRLRGFQLRHPGVWWGRTVGGIGTGGERERKQLRTACTALAATVGTGNIAGVATAIAAGGPGAVFWMWVSALLGMATAYGEVVLGVRYRLRCRREGGEELWLGGPFLYLERGLKSQNAGKVYSSFCLLASLGMGSMVQANSISDSFSTVFTVPPLLTAMLVALLAGAVILGGIRRISEVAVRLVPVSAGLYLLLCGMVLLCNVIRLPQLLLQILQEACSVSGMAGGAAGYGMTRAIRYGVARGVFSNEAGLGSLAILHSSSEDSTEEEQGMWAIFEVFFDTMVSCTLTAFVILCMGKNQQGEGSALVAACFGRFFGAFGGWMTAVSMALFAFATIIAWFYLGQQAVTYLFYKKRGGSSQKSALRFYGICYLGAVFLGGIARLELVWELSDLFNGLMAVPNLAALLLLSGQIRPPKQKKRQNKMPLQQ